MIRFDREVCSDLPRAVAREWLETNGIGGFASSTIVGLNTRRYHGLLVAATQPPVGRMVLLSKLEETVIAGSVRTDLSSNRYPGVVHPDGYRLLREFRLDPFPIATFRVGFHTIEKSVCMIHGENTTVVRYALTSPSSPPEGIELELRPLLACRDYHALTHENDAIDRGVETTPTGIVLRAYTGVPPVHLSCHEGEVRPGDGWYRHFEYDAERARGLDFVEDLFNPCMLRCRLTTAAPVVIAASTAPVDALRAATTFDTERSRRTQIAGSVPSPDPMVRTLGVAADQFIVRRRHGHTVIAGYHWFSDWGRDTMISLPGLTLETGRLDVAREIIREFLDHLDRGLVPNRFSDAGVAEYTCADATLWLFHAVHLLRLRAPDDDFIRGHVYEALGQIIDWHIRGTRYNIAVDDDGLLRAGPAPMPLTWMDVTIGGHIVTPRFGHPVELQALWYNAMRVMMQLARGHGDAARRGQCARLARRVRRAFTRSFWNPATGCLYDVIDGMVRDASIRPNQVLALSLPFSMVPRDKAISVLDVVERDLLTPYGLRTLAPSDPQYRRRFDGDAHSRDGAYHQGTVWPWLIGPFVDAYLRVHATPEARAQVREWLGAFRDHLGEAGLGQVSEVFDGDPPHHAAGCIAQAWSVAEVLRAMLASRAEAQGA